MNRNDGSNVRTELYMMKEPQAERDLKSVELLLSIAKIVCIVLAISIAFMVPCWWNARSIRQWVVNPDYANQYEGEYGYEVYSGKIAMDASAMSGLRDAYDHQMQLWQWAILIAIAFLIASFFVVRSAKIQAETAKGRLRAIRAENRIKQ